ncbi:hypothetical protein H7F15_01635 [Pontibacter sp. Tf4]|uniref:hypothetical protein n=1 Tax=Pontibacter sp. Tf4 TaxID=2761620 RepID=UPI001628F709|nr:hypothetical protein [Pontibacter sp. Tf4]MBB6609726.1 hypothetical protein [Pontibacter sp. Tf4]
MNTARSIREITDGWASLATTVPTEVKNTAASYSIAPQWSTGTILAYFIQTMQCVDWPKEIRDKLIQFNWHRDILEKIAAYAAKDIEAMQKLNINPQKGLLLMGPVGCGKTEIILMLKKFIKSGIKEEYVYDIMMNCSEKGEKALSPYRFGPIFSQSGKPIDCLFDDLGVDPPITHFGRKIIVGQELIYIRHLFFKKTGAKSHFTTNLNVEELTEYYKNISRSRLREMCNVIQFPKDAPDLRH